MYLKKFRLGLVVLIFTLSQYIYCTIVQQTRCWKTEDNGLTAITRSTRDLDEFSKYVLIWFRTIFVKKKASSVTRRTFRIVLRRGGRQIDRCDFTNLLPSTNRVRVIIG